MSQAYLQLVNKLTREFYVQPKQCFILKPSEQLRLHKQPHGLADSDDYWHVKMTIYLRHDLKMTPLTRDLARFIYCLTGSLRRMIGIHANSSIKMGNKDILGNSKLAEQCFESNPLEHDNLTFASISITKHGKCYRIH